MVIQVRKSSWAHNPQVFSLWGPSGQSHNLCNNSSRKFYVLRSSFAFIEPHLKTSRMRCPDCVRACLCVCMHVHACACVFMLCVNVWRLEYIRCSSQVIVSSAHPDDAARLVLRDPQTSACFCLLSSGITCHRAQLFCRFWGFVLMLVRQTLPTGP